MTATTRRIVQTAVTFADFAAVYGVTRIDDTTIWVSCPSGYDPALITAGDVDCDPAIIVVLAPIDAVERATSLADLATVLRSYAPADTDRTIDWTSLPTYGGQAPADTQGVWSWDEDALLVGTCADDLTIVRRDGR